MTKVLVLGNRRDDGDRDDDEIVNSDQHSGMLI